MATSPQKLSHSPEFLDTVNQRWAVTRWGFAKFIYVIITYLVLAFRSFFRGTPQSQGPARQLLGVTIYETYTSLKGIRATAPASLSETSLVSLLWKY